MAITASETGYTHAQKNGNVSYTTAKGHEHIVSYSKKTKKMTVLWGKKYKVISKSKKSSGGSGG